MTRMIIIRAALIEHLEPRQLLAGSRGGGNTPFVNFGSGAPIPPATAEVLARGIAYEPLTEGNQLITFDGVTYPYKVAKVFRDGNNGLDAFGLTSEQFGPALICRGTQGNPGSDFEFADLLADADPRGIGYDQFSSTWKKVKTWLASLHTGVDFIGHSLGGALTQWFASAWSWQANDPVQSVDQVFTFEAPGITDSRTLFPNLITYATSFDSSRVRSCTHYIVLGDIIVMAGEKFITGEVVTATFKSLNPLTKHKAPVLNAKVGTDVRPPDTVLGTMPLATLNAPSYVHNDADYRAYVLIFQLAMDGVAVVQPALLPLTLAPALMLRRDTSEASRKVLGAMLRAVVNTWTASVNAAGQLVVGLKNGVAALYKATTFTFDRSFSITKVGNTLKFAGGMKLNMGKDFTIPLPDLFGGPITVDNLVQLVDLDTDGIIDASKMLVHGRVAMLNSFAAVVDATAEFNWAQSKLVVSGSTSFLGGFITTEGATTVTGAGNLYSDGTATVSIPDGVGWPLGGWTLASGRFVFNFNVNNIGGSYLQGTGNTRLLNGVGVRVYLNGSWETIGVKALFGFAPGAGTGGQTFDVAANQDWLLLQASWENPSNSAQIQLTAPGGQILTEADIATNPDMEIVPELTDSTHRTVYIANPAAGPWHIEMVDPTGLGTVTYGASVNAPALGGSFTSVTGGQHHQPVQISFHADDPTGNATVSLFYDTDGAGTGATLIAPDLEPDATGTVDYAWDVHDVPTGTVHLFAVVTAPQSAAATVYAPSPLNITAALPTVIHSDFAFELGQSVSVSFDQDVSQSLAAGDFTLTNLTTGQVVPLADLELDYDIFSNTATLTVINGVLSDGNYRLTASASSITNDNGDPLDADVAVDFFVLAGDVNRDRHVNALDQSIITLNLDNFGTFSAGDSNYDAFVDAADQAIFDTNAQAWLPPQGALALPTSSGNDAYVLRYESPKFFDVYSGTAAGGTPLYRIFTGAVSALSMSGDAGNDTLVLDYSLGAPFPPSGIAFDGGADSDALAIVGTDSVSDVAAFAQTGATVNGFGPATSANIELLSFDGRGGEDAVSTTGGPQVVFPSTQHFASLSIGAGASATVAASSSSVLVTHSLSLDPAALLDLNGADMILFYTGSSPLSAVAGLIRTARNGGAWNGPGLGSTSARNRPAHDTTLGVIDAADYRSVYGASATFDGEAIAGQQAVLVKYTYYGDTDFNGKVDGADYARIDATFNQESFTHTDIGGWFNGDCDYNDKVDGADYALIDSAFNSQGTALRPPGGAGRPAGPSRLVR